MRNYGDHYMEIEDNFTDRMIQIGKFRVFRTVFGLLMVENVWWWWGTDALTLDTYPPGALFWKVRIFFRRLKLRLLLPFVSQHWIVSDVLRKHLLNFGIKDEKIFIEPCPVVYEKIDYVPHPRFTVLFYYPDSARNDKFKRWKYGMDIIEELHKLLPQDIRWIHANGKMDLSKIWGATDFYLRPSRHDGDPRMVKEAKAYGIPFYYREDFEHNIKEIEKIIKEHYENFKHRQIKSLAG